MGDLIKNFEEVKKRSSEPEVVSKYDYFLRRLKAWQKKNKVVYKTIQYW